jgi:EpsD family peptidyl-prolyl cis-trans isomerase
MRQRVILVLLVALATTACQKKASGQTVAVVNNEEITASELNDALTQDPSMANLNTKDARAVALERLIDRKLLVQQARADGIDKSPEFINRQRRGIEDLLINMLVSRKVNTTQVPSPDEINRFEASRPEMFANREAWTLSQILYPLPVNRDVTTKLAEAKTLDQVAQNLTANHVQFTRATKQIDTAVLPHNIYLQLSKLAAGEPFVVPGPGKAIASAIVGRQPQPLAGDQARQIALAAMRREQVQNFIRDRVKNLKAAAKIEYQPGFTPPKK